MLAKGWGEMEQGTYDSAIVFNLLGMFIVFVSLILSYEKKSVNKLGKYWGFAVYAFPGAANIVCGMVGWQTNDWFMVFWHPLLGCALLYYWLFVICAIEKRRVP